MSFRNPFITDFIYQASDETKDANPVLERILREYATVDHVVDERGYGYFSGIFRDTAWGTERLNLDKMVNELSAATKVPFRLTILLESGPSITYEITPPLT